MSATLTRLDSGLRVVSDRMDTVETASVGVWVGVGTRHEEIAVHGVSHVLEHMAFKGTRRRSARAIAEEIEAVGGHINAYTSREHTAYYAKVLKDDFDLAVDLIADILQHSTFDEAEFAREREVIVQEIHQVADTPDDIVFDHFQETAYPGQALGRPVLGSAESVRAMTRDAVLGYLGQHYGPENIVVAAAGRVDHERVVALAAAKFDSLPPPRPSLTPPARYVGGDCRRTRDLEQAHIILGFDGIPYGDPDFYAASVFSALFGGGMSSRLFQEVREKRGLAYSIYSYLSCYTDGGLFAIYAGTGENEAAELIPLVADEMMRVGEDASDEEVARARAQLKASILMGLESTSARCEQAARHVMLYGRPLTPAELTAKIEAVDTAAVRRVAKRLAKSAPTVTALGPVAKVEDFARIKARFG